MSDPDKIRVLGEDVAVTFEQYGGADSDWYITIKSLLPGIDGEEMAALPASAMEPLAVWLSDRVARLRLVSGGASS